MYMYVNTQSHTLTKTHLFHGHLLKLDITIIIITTPTATIR